MSKKIETYGSIKGGVLHISYRDMFYAALAAWPDCRVRLRVERLYRKRSLEQNAYYFGVICHEFCEGALEEWGEKLTTEQAHEELKKNCNYKEVTNKRTGEITRISMTTTDLTTTQFMEYIESCRDFIQEWFGRYVPAPGEQTELPL